MGLREANQNFSKAIRLVRSGQEVVLTDRGRPIAVIRPLGTGAGAEETIERLEQSGWLRPAAKRRRLPDFTPIRIRGRPLSDTVSRDREER